MSPPQSVLPVSGVYLQILARVHHALCMSAVETLPTENLLTVQIDQEKL